MKITGTVIDTAKRALVGYRVAAYHGDVDLKKEKALATARTAKDRLYSLVVDLALYSRGVNILIAVLNEQSQAIWSSPIHYNAKDDLVSDARIPEAKLVISEDQCSMGTVASLLKGARLAELQPTRIAYLAERSIAQAELSILIAAARGVANLGGTDLLFPCIGTPRFEPDHYCSFE
jgi:hypothetical protein